MVDVEKLLAAIDEREKIARECGDEDDRRWKWSLLSETVRTESGDYVACGPYDCDVKSEYALHMVRNDPNVVIRCCRADRRQVERLAEMAERGEEYYDNSTVWNLVQDSLEDFAAAYGLSVEEETTMEEVLKTPPASGRGRRRCGSVRLTGGARTGSRSTSRSRSRSSTAGRVHPRWSGRGGGDR